ncbi:MAG: ATP-binding protein [Oscillospiraceae bacterium]
MSGLGLPPWDRLERSRAGQPYADGAELLTDELAWLDGLLETAFAQREAGVHLPGVAVPAGENGLSDSRLPRQEPDCPDRDALRAGQDYILTRALASGELPLLQLFARYDMNGLERLALLLLLAPMAHRKYSACYGRLQGGTQIDPTELLVRSLYGLYATERPGEALALCDPSSPLRRTLFQPERGDSLGLRRRVWLWLHGSTAPAGESARFCSLIQPTAAPLLVGESRYRALRAQVERGRPALIQLWGRPGSGRRFFLQHLSHDLHRTIYTVDWEALCACETRETVLDCIALDCRLTGCLLHLIGWQEGREGERLLARLAALSPLLFLSTDRPRVLGDSGLPPTVLLSLDEWTPADRLTLWQAERDCLSHEVELSLCADRYRLTPGGIRRACAEAAAAAGGEPVTPAGLQECVYRGSTGRLETLATRVRPAYSWEDLVLPPEQKEVLALARDRLRLRRQVDEDWGFGEKFAYGRGLSLLFCGPPGTGKTMAAQVLAREIGMELFRVDMSRLTSKYIGESEKNISRIFDAARDSNAILFFDEADSLFARRTEVQNSNDRYANAEVSFLLQKMEEYDGMCILSTNLAKNFDMAFFRRLTFVVRFEMPDAARRLVLWQAAFPPQAPLGQLDLKHFAEALELSGSSIKSMAYNAACLAAAEGADISRRHLIAALRLENAKTGKLFFPEDL